MQSFAEHPKIIGQHQVVNDEMQNDAPILNEMRNVIPLRDLEGW